VTDATDLHDAGWRRIATTTAQWMSPDGMRIVAEKDALAELDARRGVYASKRWRVTNRAARRAHEMADQTSRP
jgi:hypothetical protein